MEYFMTEIQTPDWERAVAWYGATLDLRVVVADAANRFALLQTAGGGRVALKQADGPVGQGAVRLVFEVADLDATVARLAGLGVAIEGPKESAEGYREVKLHDPDGTPIGLFAWVARHSEAVG